MSEDAPTTSTPQDPAAEPQAEYEEGDEGGGGGFGGRGCLPILVGVFLLLAGAFLGTRFARHFIPVETVAEDPSTQPVPLTSPSDSAQAAALARTDRPPVEMHYLVVSNEAETDGRAVNAYGMVAELWPTRLPLKAPLAVTVAVSAANLDRRLAINGFYADGKRFLEAELPLNEADPRRPRVSAFAVPLELTSTEPLVFEVFTDDRYLIGRRIIGVRLRPTTGPTTGPTTEPTTQESEADGATAPDAQPEPGPAPDGKQDAPPPPPP